MQIVPPEVRAVHDRAIDPIALRRFLWSTPPGGTAQGGTPSGILYQRDDGLKGTAFR
tara:strand:- start:812 stop:982 length:171 start_codon:yes stop_codon:yes gene_type:complete